MPLGTPVTGRCTAPCSPPAKSAATSRDPVSSEPANCHEDGTATSVETRSGTIEVRNRRTSGSQVVSDDSGTVEIRTRVRRTPCAEDTKLPHGPALRFDAGASIKAFASRAGAVFGLVDDNGSVGFDAPESPLPLALVHASGAHENPVRIPLPSGWLADIRVPV